MAEESKQADAQPTDYQALGMAFLTMGIGLTISLGIVLSPAFLGTGVPFIVLGLIFMTRKPSDEAAEGDD
ncbi:MAG: hypothetical protein CL808_01415 [Citromicrobium sp.]|nr:hypothetical protein [Citromicrobium sp.]